MVSPLIDSRTADQIVTQTTQLAQTLTQTLPLLPVSEKLIGYKLAQDIVDPTTSEPHTVIAQAGTLIGAQLVERLKQIPDLTSVQVQGWVANTNPDAGMALIQIFGRFAEIVINRLNQLPEKNFLSFLNLIGVDVTPPQPARVPVTFQLAQSGRDNTLAALVPAGSRVAAPASQTNPQEAVFETEQALALTSAQLTKVIVSLPHEATLNNPSASQDSDKYEEQTNAALGQIDAWFYPFRETTAAIPINHNFYVAADAFRTMPDNTAVTLKMITAPIVTPGETNSAQSPDPAAYLAALPVQWSYYDQGQKAWVVISDVQSTAEDNAWQVVLSNVPHLVPSSVNNIQGAWLQAQLQTPLLPANSTFWQIPLQQVQISLPGNRPALSPQQGFLNSQPLDLSKDFYPFGQQPAFNDTFYLACDQVIEQGAQAGDTITLTVTLRQAGQTNGSQTNPSDKAIALTWEYWNGTGWQALGPDSDQFKDNTTNFTNGTDPKTITFKMPLSFAATAVNNQQGYWLRIRLIGGGYGHAAYYDVQAYYQMAGGNATDSQTVKVPIYQLIPANFVPPIIKDLQFTINDVTGGNPPSWSVSLTACLTYNNLFYTDCTDQAKGTTATFYPFLANPDHSPTLYLGFDRPFEERTITLYAQVEPPPPDDVAAEKIKALSNPQPPQLAWEYAGKFGWKPLDVLDETRIFTQSGLWQFIGPADWAQRPCFGYTDLYWLRVRWNSGYFVAQPRLRRLLTNTTWASQVTTIRNEVLGGSNGQARQNLRAAQTPILPGLRLEVREPALPSLAEQAQIIAAEGPEAITILRNNAGQMTDIWICWHPVSDFYGSGPGDRHFTVDWAQGQIRFGDGRYGLIPPPGTNNIRLVRYQTGGGSRGNRLAKAITQLKSSLPYVQSVINYEAAVGGADRESMNSVKRFGPHRLRHRDRAVAAADVEDLAYAASPAVARAQAIMPQFDSADLWLDTNQKPTIVHDQANKTAGTIGIVIVPDSADPQPVPSLALLSQVKTYIQAHCGATAQVWVSGPDWGPVSVMATVVPTSLAVADVLEDRIQTALTQFLHPLTGGAAGHGWEFGDTPHESDFYAVISQVPGVDHIKPLSLQISGLPAGAARLSPSTLIYSGQHTIILTL